MEFLVVKWIHVVSSTFLFGTGLGSAFYLYFTYRSGNIQSIATTNALVVKADWVFTTPTIIIQPVTGALLVGMGDYSFGDLWILTSISLFVLAGLCWLPVVYLQIRLRDIARDCLQGESRLPSQYRSFMRVWFCLGVPAFFSLLLVFYLMVSKPVSF